MATQTPPTPMSNGKLAGAIIAGIIYLLLVIVGIMYKTNTNDDFAYKVSINLFWISCIPFAILVFCLNKDFDSFEEIKKSAKKAVYHILLWVAIIVFPFRNHYVLGTIMIMFFAVFALSQTVSFKTKADYDANELKSFSGISTTTKWFGIILLIIIVLSVLFTNEDVKTIVSKNYDNFKRTIGIGGGSYSDSESSDFLSSRKSPAGDTYYPEEEKPNQMTATVTSYSYPLDFGAECPIMVNANATVNFGDNIIKATVFFKRGNIVINSGTVDDLNEEGFGSVSGTWQQSKTGISGSYKWTITGAQTGVLILYMGDTQIALIDFYSSADV